MRLPRLPHLESVLASITSKLARMADIPTSLQMRRAVREAVVAQAAKATATESNWESFQVAPPLKVRMDVFSYIDGPYYMLLDTSNLYGGDKVRFILSIAELDHAVDWRSRTSTHNYVIYDIIEIDGTNHSPQNKDDMRIFSASLPRVNTVGKVSVEYLDGTNHKVVLNVNVPREKLERL